MSFWQPHIFFQFLFFSSSQAKLPKVTYNPLDHSREAIILQSKPRTSNFCSVSTREFFKGKKGEVSKQSLLSLVLRVLNYQVAHSAYLLQLHKNPSFKTKQPSINQRDGFSRRWWWWSQGPPSPYQLHLQAVTDSCDGANMAVRTTSNQDRRKDSRFRRIHEPGCR